MRTLILTALLTLAACSTLSDTPEDEPVVVRDPLPDLLPDLSDLLPVLDEDAGVSTNADMREE